MTAILLMGVSGSGKTTVGTLLARALGTRFVDADSLHSEANRQKMAAGIPLNDMDRAPWLAAVGVALAKGNVVVACSALRRAYRDRLRKSTRATSALWGYEIARQRIGATIKREAQIWAHAGR